MQKNSRSDICIPQELIDLLGRPKAPQQVWQEPFDYVRGHCEAIADTSKPTDMLNFTDYFLDYQYMHVQRDLFEFALPHALEGWARTVLERPAADRFSGTWHYEGMWDAFSYRPLYPEFLNDKQNKALMAFLVNVLIALMEKENKLSFEGSGATPYAWTRLHAILITLFPLAEPIWRRWWDFPSAGLAVCGVQWLSAFLYEAHENPYFSPSTPSEGGGPPLVFETPMIRDAPANAESAAFFERTLQPDWARDALTRATLVLHDHQRLRTVETTLSEFGWRSVLFQERASKFVSVLRRREAWKIIDWDEV